MLHNFANLTKGANPYARVIRDPAGNLYGTTYNGGKSNAGVVFKVSASGQEAVLHSFTGGADGADPRAGVIEDSSGNLYGTTCYGDTANAGVVFKVAASGPETVLYTFAGGTAGANPLSGVILDSSGNLYGTAYLCGSAGNLGLVYELNTSGQETVQYTFPGVGDGSNPYAGLVRDSSGNFSGTTFDGGTANTGVLYKLSAAGQETVLHSFTGGT